MLQHATSLQVRSSTTVLHVRLLAAYADATNHDAAATMENGTCEFDFTDPCPADVNEDGQVGTPDLLFFLSQFGSDCPE